MLVLNTSRIEMLNVENIKVIKIGSGRVSRVCNSIGNLANGEERSVGVKMVVASRSAATIARIRRVKGE